MRPALAARGVPAGIYVDNGSAFCDAWLLRACAKLGVRLVHSAPGRPQGRGKIERFFRTVREQFLVEVTDTSSEDLAAAGVDHQLDVVAHLLPGRLHQEFVEAAVATAERPPAELDGAEAPLDDARQGAAERLGLEPGAPWPY